MADSKMVLQFYNACRLYFVFKLASFSNTSSCTASPRTYKQDYTSAGLAYMYTRTYYTVYEDQQVLFQ